MAVNQTAPTKARAAAIAVLTKDAYEYGLHYRKNVWVAIAKWMLDSGLTNDQTTAVLYSKHMRWCADGRAVSDGRWADLADFVRYYRADSNKVKAFVAEVAA
jgi:hypothetical protein